MNKLNNKELKELGYELLDFDESKMTKLIQFMEHFPVSGKAPRGMKKDKEKVDHLHNMIKLHQETGLVSSNISAVFSYYQKKEDLDHLIDSFSGKDKVEKIKHGRLTFINESSMSEKRFKENAKGVFELLKGLKGFHRKAIEKPISISFKKASDMKSKATYKSESDEMWLKESLKLDPEERYGSIQYVIMHELGHRFERKFGHPENFSESNSYTTDYSKTESWSGSEPFAELFALSNWKDKYPQFEDKINRFEKGMREHVLDKENGMSL